MNLFELFVKIGVDDQASGKLKDLGGKLGNGLKTAAKIGTAAVGAAAAGITALTTAAVNNYAEYEQLVGGVETLFKGSADKVQEYAANAYKTAGMSANEYMSTVTSFSASLLQLLGGDTDKAAEYANQALTDMSDNANKMGTSMEMIQNAYQGFAKQNYTMLDNLKLGYGGTQTEMARLIKDAAKLDKTVKANDMSFGNIVKAIHAVQTQMGITGTTAKEAGATISGSVQSMKSAWQNLVTGLADGNADIGKLVDNLVTTIVGDGTENNLGVLGNIMPAVKRALNGAAKLVDQLFPKIIKEIPDIINENLPVLAKAAVGIIESLVKGISQNQKKLMKTASQTIAYLVKSFVKLLPEIIELGLEILISLAEGISENLKELVPTIVDVIIKIVDTLTNPKTLNNLFDAALEIIETLAELLLRDDVLNGLIDSAVRIIISIADFITNNIDKLFAVAVKIIVALVEYLLDTKNLSKLAEAAGEIIMSLGNALGSAVEGLSGAVADIIAWIVKKFTGIDLSESGKKAMETFFMGMLGIAKAKDTTSIIKAALDKQGKLPKENVDGSHRYGLDYVPYDGYIAELHKGERVLTASEASGYGGTSIGNITINIDGAKYSDEQSLASAIALEIQNMTDRRAAVYA